MPFLDLVADQRHHQKVIVAVLANLCAIKAQFPAIDSSAAASLAYHRSGERGIFAHVINAAWRCSFSIDQARTRAVQSECVDVFIYISVQWKHYQNDA